MSTFNILKQFQLLFQDSIYLHHSQNFFLFLYFKFSFCYLFLLTIFFYPLLVTETVLLLPIWYLNFYYFSFWNSDTHFLVLFPNIKIVRNSGVGSGAILGFLRCVCQWKDGGQRYSDRASQIFSRVYTWYFWNNPSINEAIFPFCLLKDRFSILASLLPSRWLYFNQRMVKQNSWSPDFAKQCIVCSFSKARSTTVVSMKLIL